jgi:hypothetical protein
MFDRDWRECQKDVIKASFLIGIIFVMASQALAQGLFINEIQSSNLSTIYDHTGDTPDWVEIFNSGDEVVNLGNYGLSDVDSLPLKWTFPDMTIPPQGHVLVFASGLDLKVPGLHWQTIIDIGDVWKYTLPQSELDGSWRSAGYDDATWQSGKSGFGYGDNDDSTLVDNTMSVFLRKSFTISNKQNVGKAYLHMDFDDAFVAYINGVEVARANIGAPGEMPAYNAPANNYDHEALMFQGGYPEGFVVDHVADYLVEGENVLAIQVHNHSITSSDLTAIPFFTLGYLDHPGFETNVSQYINFIPIGLHANFKIDADGENIIFSDPNGVQIDSVFTSKINPDVSFGRQPDGGGKWCFFVEPTPGSSNSTTGLGPVIIPDVQFSYPGGYYNSGLNLELTTDNPSDSIYYTSDGSEPTSGDHLYASPIFINTPRVIRAGVLRSGFLPGDVGSNSYLINVDHELPVVFVNTDPRNLWDNEYGIYVMGNNASLEFPHHGANFWEDWERPANIAMYEPDGTLAFQLEAGIKIFGNWSRGQAQKSLSIHTRKSYGYDGINYKIFEEKEIGEFKTLILRNSGNDFNNTMLRDAFCNRIVASRQIDQQAYRPSVVYLNGEYWGIHNIREKINEEYISSNYGIDEDEIDILEFGGSIVRGSADHYESMLSYIAVNSLVSDQHYDHVRTQMDIRNFIQYQIAEIFIDNRDWPGNNIKFWRERNGTGRWRWIMFDSDFGFNTWEDNNQAFNTLQFALEPNGPDWPNPPWSTFLFRNLILNTKFRHDFINAFADNLNTIFAPDVMEDLLDEMVDAIDGEIPEHLNRWSGDLGYWNNRIAAMRGFVRERRGYVRNHIRSVFGLSGMFSVNVDSEGNGHVKINTLTLTSFPWNGMYFNNIPVKFEAIPDPGYRFVEWRGVENNENERLTINVNEGIELTAVFEKVYEPITNIVINEINYSSSETFDVGDWIELLNAGDHAVNLSGCVIKDDDDAHEFIFPEGTVIHAHDYLVVCRDKSKFLMEFPLTETVEGEMSFGLGSNDCVRLFSPEGVAIDEVCYENSLPWPAEADGLGATLSLTNANSNNDHPLNWAASVNHGTPGAKNTDVITHLPREEMIYLPEMRLYPNPVSTGAILEIQGPMSQKVEVVVTDMTGGKTIVARNYQINEGANSIALETSKMGLRAGVYIVQVLSDNSHQSLRMVISE